MNVLDTLVSVVMLGSGVLLAGAVIVALVCLTIATWQGANRIEKALMIWTLVFGICAAYASSRGPELYVPAFLRGIL